MSLVGESPDAYSRFSLILYILGQLEPNLNDKKILDMGGASEHMSMMMNERGIKAELTVIDILDRPAKLPRQTAYIKASASDSGLADKSFDYVIMTDLLEHVKGDVAKKSILKEAARLAKHGVVVSGPIDSQQTTNYEHALNDLNKFLFKSDQPWLKEHFTCKKPSLSLIESSLGNAKFKTHHLYSLPHEFWYQVSVINLMRGYSLPKNLHKSAIVANTAYNLAITEKPKLAFTESGYRAIVVATKKSIANKLPSLDDSSGKFHTQQMSEYSIALSKILKKLSSSHAKAGQLSKDIKYYKAENKRLSQEAAQLYERLNNTDAEPAQQPQLSKRLRSRLKKR